MRIAIIGSNIKISDEVLDIFNSVGDVLRIDEYPVPEVLIRGARDADVLVTWGKIDRTVLENLPTLKLVCLQIAGWDICVDSSITEEYLSGRGLRICYTAGAASGAVAEFTLTAILGAARNFIPFRMKERRKAFSFSDLRVGVIGFGFVGKRLTEMLSSLGIQWLVNTSHPGNHPDLPREKARDLSGLCSEVNVIAVTCSLNRTSRGLIGSACFSGMRPHCLLVNAARAAVFDLPALKNFLEVSPASVAVIDDLQKVDELCPGLSALPNCHCTPHIAFNTAEALESYPGTAARILKLWAKKDFASLEKYTVRPWLV